MHKLRQCIAMQTASLVVHFFANGGKVELHLKVNIRLFAHRFIVLRKA